MVIPDLCPEALLFNWRLLVLGLSSLSRGYRIYLEATLGDVLHLTIPHLACYGLRVASGFAATRVHARWRETAFVPGAHASLPHFRMRGLAFPHGRVGSVFKVFDPFELQIRHLNFLDRLQGARKWRFRARRILAHALGDHRIGLPPGGAASIGRRGRSIDLCSQIFFLRGCQLICSHSFCSLAFSAHTLQIRVGDPR